jgi:hypothetical protein
VADPQKGLQNDSVVTVAVRSLATDLGAESVVLDVDAGEYWSLSPVSARIWTLVQEPRSVSSIVEVLLEEYDVDPERCEGDVKTVLDDMRAHGLVKVVGRPKR